MVKRNDDEKAEDKAAEDLVKEADAKGDPTVRDAAQRREASARGARASASRDAVSTGRTRTSTSPDAKDVEDVDNDGKPQPNLGAVRDEDADPLSVSAEVIDNAYVELTIDGKKFKLWFDELHRLRKVMDRAAIELPR